MSTMPRAFIRILALTASFALAPSSLVRADYAHDQAQQSVAHAQADLDAAKARADQAQAALGSASAAAVDLSARLDAARQQAGDIRQRMDRGQAALPEIRARIDAATNTLDARRREMAVADMRYGPLKFADEQVRLNAIKSFEESAEYRSALKAVSDTAAALQTTGAESLRLGHQPASDPNVQIAQSRLDAAKAALDALRGKFMEERLPQIPRVASADQALAAEQAEYDVISAAAKNSEKELAEAHAQFDRQNAGLAGDQVTLGQLSANIDHLQTELATAQAAANQAADEAGRALAYADAAQQSRDSAVAALQQLDVPQFVAPYPSYGYASPPVFYGQPGSIYVPAPYFGNLIVTPSRGAGYGYGGNRGFQGPGPAQPNTHAGHSGNGGNGAHR